MNAYLCCSPTKRKESLEVINKLKNDFELIDDLSGIKEATVPIIVLGGDGTINYLCNLLGDQGEYNILYLPNGTANDFSKSLRLGLSGYPLSYREIVEHSAQLSIPVMKCNDRLFINVASFGEPAKITDEGKGIVKEYTGRVSYYLSAAEGLFSSEPMRVKVLTHNVKQEFETLGGFVSQGAFVGGGVKTNLNASTFFKDHFNFSMTTSCNVIDSISSLIKVQNGSEHRVQNLISENCKDLILTSKKSIKVKLDGESYENKKLHFRKSKLKLNFYSY